MLHLTGAGCGVGNLTTLGAKVGNSACRANAERN